MAQVDALSRNPSPTEIAPEEVDIVQLEVSDWILAGQLTDNNLCEIRKALAKNMAESVEEEHIRRENILKDCRIYRNTTEGARLGVPYELRRDIIASELLYGYKPGAVTDVLLTAEVSNIDEYRRKVSAVRQEAAKHISAAQQQKKYFHKRRTIAKRCNVGDLVLTQKIHAATGFSQKLLPAYADPFRVSTVLPNDRYERILQDNKLEKFKVTNTASPKNNVIKKTVINLSHTTLTEEKAEVLQKGLSFALTPKQVPTMDIITATEATVYNLPDTSAEELRWKIKIILEKSTTIKFLLPILSPLVDKTESFVKNSEHFVELTKNFSLESEDIIVSFDVESLFTNIPLEESIKIIETKLKDDQTLHERTDLTINRILQLRASSEAMWIKLYKRNKKIVGHQNQGTQNTNAERRNHQIEKCRTRKGKEAPDAMGQHED
ncbi:hypothetical protein CBL_20441 [Carabus blaptoides fortunei]